MTAKTSGMQEFSPRLDALPESARRLWGELREVPEEFTLYGGTAIALQLGHRKSGLFDFFGCRSVDVIALERGTRFLARAEVIQRDKDLLSAIVDRGAPVRVQFVALPKLPRLAAPLVARDTRLKVASLLDLAGTKAMVLQVRAAAQDYIDMDALIHMGGVSLPLALAAGQRLYGKSFNPEITLKALSYFEDGDLRELPADLKLRLVNAIRAVNPGDLPRLAPYKDIRHGPST